jgi:hypothetical protein
MPRLALLEIPLLFNNTTGNLQNLEGKSDDLLICVIAAKVQICYNARW